MKTTKTEANIEKILDELSLNYERNRIVLFKEFFVSVWILIDRVEIIMFEEDVSLIAKNKDKSTVLSFMEKLGGKKHQKVFLEKRMCSFSEEYIAKRLYDLYSR